MNSGMADVAAELMGLDAHQCQGQIPFVLLVIENQVFIGRCQQPGMGGDFFFQLIGIPGGTTQGHQPFVADAVVGDGIDRTVAPIKGTTVGDWIMLDPKRPSASRVLARKSLIKRRAPGTGRQVQLIAANLDTIFVVSSCNQDFNIARLERFIAIAFEAGIDPVIVLTKADLVDDAERYRTKAQSISDLVPVVTLDARGEEPGKKLAAWCKPGQTVAFLGSSGVGKSTLTNAMAGSDAIATQPIREDDAKGRRYGLFRPLSQ